MLGVVRHARRIAMPPDRINFVNIGDGPVAQLRGRGRNAGFLHHLAQRRLQQRLVRRIFGAGDALPETGVVGALDQQHLQLRRVDHDQHRLGDFEGFQNIPCRLLAAS